MSINKGTFPNVIIGCTSLLNKKRPHNNTLNFFLNIWMPLDEDVISSI